MRVNLFIKDIFNKEKEAEQVFSKSSLQREYQSILDNFQMGLSTEKDVNSMMMELNMKVNGRMEKNMALEN
jgi:hypothetical protein